MSMGRLEQISQLPPLAICLYCCSASPVLGLKKEDVDGMEEDVL